VIRERRSRQSGDTRVSEARPTPRDPMPGVKDTAGVPSAKRKLPPELGTDAIAVLEGRAFVYSDSRGDIPPGSIGGLVDADTRFLSRWELTFAGRKLDVLRSQDVDYYSAAFFLTNPDLDGLPKNSLAVRRLRTVGNGLREEIQVTSFADHPVSGELRLSVGNDFADLFEIKDRVRDRSDQIVRAHDAARSALAFRYQNQGFAAETRVRSSKPARLDGDDLVWDLELEARRQWATHLAVSTRLKGRLIQPARRAMGEADLLSRWEDEVPRFESDSPILQRALEQSVADLAALRIQGKLPGGPEFTLPAAGLPWFMTLFGRDTCFSAYQSLWVGPQLARGGIETLALAQGRTVDDFRDEEPGKILHEFRGGELTRLGLKPHSPYYGNTDATQLWLILLSEHWRWSGDDEFVGALWPNVLAALEWMRDFGDLDGDGFIEYATRSSQGLGNQCWKDSWDAVQFADGTIPYLPIAIVEAQGYAVDARRRVAELATRVMGDSEIARDLMAAADQLARRIDASFWIPRRSGYYAVGLDGDKRQVDSMTSNMGHLLWSGAIPKARAAHVVKHLMSDDMFSGWGVRTLSRRDHGFNPIGYHLGTIWPHDNSIIAAGLGRYGYRDEANRIALAQLEAARFSRFRLPEAFAGFDRSVSRFPVPYPTACSPQAWATGAPFLLLRTMLGLEARDGELAVDPRIPDEIGRVAVHGVHAFGQRWDVEAIGSKGHVRLAG